MYKKFTFLALLAAPKADVSCVTFLEGFRMKISFPGIENRTFFSAPEQEDTRQHKSRYFIETHHASKVG